MQTSGPSSRLYRTVLPHLDVHHCTYTKTAELLDLPVGRLRGDCPAPVTRSAPTLVPTPDSGKADDVLVLDDGALLVVVAALKAEPQR